MNKRKSMEFAINRAQGVYENLIGELNRLGMDYHSSPIKIWGRDERISSLYIVKPNGERLRVSNHFPTKPNRNHPWININERSPGEVMNEVLQWWGR